MENFQAKGLSLQDSLRNLSLIPNKERDETFTDLILVGKVITTRCFRKFTMSEILRKIWKLSARFQIDKIEKNVFKIRFGNKKD